MVAPNCSEPKRHYLHKRWSDCHVSLRAFDPTDPSWGSYYEAFSEPWPGQVPVGTLEISKKGEWTGNEASGWAPAALEVAATNNTLIAGNVGWEESGKEVPAWSDQVPASADSEDLHKVHSSTPPSPFLPQHVPVLTLSRPSSTSDPPPSPFVPPAPPPTPLTHRETHRAASSAASKHQRPKRVRWVDDPVKDLPSLTDVLEVQVDGTLNLLRILARTLELSILLSESCTNKAIAISAQEHAEFPESTIPEVPGSKEIEREERVAQCIFDDAREVRELLRDVRGDDCDECEYESCDDTREEDKEMDMVIEALDMLVRNARGVLEELSRMGKEKERGGS